MEVGAVLRVRNSLTRAEGLHHCVERLETAGHQLPDGSDAIEARLIDERLDVTGRNRVTTSSEVDLEDAAGRLLLEPFADVTLTECQGAGQFRGSRRTAIGQGPVQAQSVAEVDGEDVPHSDGGFEQPLDQSIVSRVDVGCRHGSAHLGSPSLVVQATLSGAAAVVQRTDADPRGARFRIRSMSVVDAASISSATVASEDLRRLSDWALSRRSPEEQLVAIELVLAHDFDERVPATLSGASAEYAQSVREDYLLGLTGIGAGRRARTPSPSPGREPQSQPVRARGAAYERRASHSRADAAVR